MTEDLFDHQYRLVQASRKVMFDFCETFNLGDYTKGVTFDGKSIRRLHVHIANTYQGWIKTVAGKEARNDFIEQDYPTIKSVSDLFSLIDTLVIDFIEESRSNWMEEVQADFPDQHIVLSKAEIFTHVITHEFHHKGQILMLARNMGYTPPDTDIIRIA